MFNKDNVFPTFMNGEGETVLLIPLVLRLKNVIDVTVEERVWTHPWEKDTRAGLHTTILNKMGRENCGIWEENPSS